MTKPTTQEIIAKVQEIRETSDYAHLGIRTQEVPFELGKVDHISHIWDDGEDTGEELDGLSCTDWESPTVRAHASDHGFAYGFYFGDHVAIIGGNHAHRSEEDGELIFDDPEVLYIFC